MARFDDIGLFWEDITISGRGKKAIRAMPPIPDTGWKAPRSYPNLSTAKVISLDTETYDPELLDNGPGWGRGKGHIVGVSIAVPGGYKWYFPIRHEILPQDNLDPTNTLAWLKDTLKCPKQPKVGANIIYDVGWLEHEGVEVAGDLIDVQFAEALLDESALVNLETLSQKYLGEGKETNDLYKWCYDFYGGKNSPSQRANIYRAPPNLVGPYAEADADLPLRLCVPLYKALHKENLTHVFDMECKLIRLLIAMRKAGVTVDTHKAQQLRDSLLLREGEVRTKLDSLVGMSVDINSSSSLARAFDRVGIPYKKTAKGNPSFTKDFLETIEHPVTDAIREIRKCNKIRRTFIESYILESNINGKIHCQFHPLRGDNSGTRSGRLSSSTPNLQNIPSRDDELANAVRSLFIPDKGHSTWVRLDYSQIEYRMFVHYAVGKGAQEARDLYINDPSTDYHEMALDLVAPETGWDISTLEKRKLWRRPIKNINFGMIYAMGTEKLARSLGMPYMEGKRVYNAYHKKVPFAKTTLESCSREAQNTGIITTIMGRKSRFDLWEPTSIDFESRLGLPYDEALAKYGRNIKRAYTHKALNRRLQGSAADLMKLAMLRCWESGVFNETGIPRLTVHDELDFSCNTYNQEAFNEVKRIMETAIPVSIPIKIDMEIGTNWGTLK